MKKEKQNRRVERERERVSDQRRRGRVERLLMVIGREPVLVSACRTPTSVARIDLGVLCGLGPVNLVVSLLAFLTGSSLSVRVGFPLRVITKGKIRFAVGIHLQEEFLHEVLGWILHPFDLEVGQWSRRHASGIRTIDAMNKSDSLAEQVLLEAADGEAHELGFGNPVAISTEVWLGMAELYEILLPILEDYML